MFNLKDLKHVLDQIVKSHQRGETCLLQKQLKSINDEEEHLKDGKKHLPRLFTENPMDKNQLDMQHFHPPASDRDDEYHIIKFYSFTTTLVSSALQMDSPQNIDFPFQVTELEHQIINLESKSPIILLGRSGTGKTTCCLYRLWVKFVNYWSKAIFADAPIYPMNSFEKKFSEVDKDQQEKREGEDMHDSKDVTNEAKNGHQTTGKKCFHLRSSSAYLFSSSFLCLAQLDGAVEYTDCISAKEVTPSLLMGALDMTLNNLIMRLQ